MCDEHIQRKSGEASWRRWPLASQPWRMRSLGMRYSLEGRVKESGFSMRRAQVNKSKTGQSSDLCPLRGRVLDCVHTKFALGRSIKPRPVKLTIYLE